MGGCKTIKPQDMYAILFMEKWNLTPEEIVRELEKEFGGKWHIKCNGWIIVSYNRKFSEERFREFMTELHKKQLNQK